MVWLGFFLFSRHHHQSCLFQLPKSLNVGTRFSGNKYVEMIQCQSASCQHLLTAIGVIQGSTIEATDRSKGRWTVCKLSFVAFIDFDETDKDCKAASRLSLGREQQPGKQILRNVNQPHESEYYACIFCGS